METSWDIQLLGGLRARRNDQVVTRFPTRKVGALLAYLAYFQQGIHPREVLIELLWPESELEAGRKSLSVALSSLRHHLEPPGVPAGSVLISDHFAVRLNTANVTTDVAAFETGLHVAAQQTHVSRQISLLTAAVEHCRAPLLPGYYEDWIPAEQARLNERLYEALIRLVALMRQEGNPAGALEFVRRAIALDALREEAHQELLRLYADTGQLSAALRHYRALERTLHEELGTKPSATTHALIAQLREENRSHSLLSQAGDTRERAEFESILLALETPANAQLPRAVPAPKASRLPTPLTRFFGREEETIAIESLLRTPYTRLVTLTGLGGSGKTRLALRVAERLRENLQGRVWFVPLADLAEARLIPDKILSALGLPRLPDTEPVEQVIEALASAPALLVLDNFEHLVEKGTSLLETLLTAVPELVCLVTSQQRLNLSGEQEFVVLPLPVPGPTDLPETLLQNDSVQLFVDRAQQVHPEFQVTPANADAVAQICYRLEGIPLALELAAARTQVLTVEQMLSQLEKPFHFLVSRRRDAEVRHRTLRAAVDWTYRLLPSELQGFFAHLAVFRGGWTIEAAKAVCEEPEALDYLEHLKDCSLVLVTEHAGEMRFQMLETLREYARELIPAKEWGALHQRHRDWFLALVEEAEPRIQLSDKVHRLQRLEQEYANLRVALEWSQVEEDGEAKRARLVGGLWRFWSLCGVMSEAQHEPRWDRALALERLAGIAIRKTDSPKGRALLQQTLEILRATGEHSGIATLLADIARFAQCEDEDTLAQALHVEQKNRVQRLNLLREPTEDIPARAPLERARGSVQRDPLHSN